MGFSNYGSIGAYTIDISTAPVSPDHADRYDFAGNANGNGGKYGNRDFCNGEQLQRNTDVFVAIQHQRQYVEYH
jgi:hypothetical protein